MVDIKIIQEDIIQDNNKKLHRFLFIYHEILQVLLPTERDQTLLQLKDAVLCQVVYLIPQIQPGLTPTNMLQGHPSLIGEVSKAHSPRMPTLVKALIIRATTLYL